MCWATGMKRFLEEEFSSRGSLYIATEDGSFGTKGNVLDAVRQRQVQGDVIFACGPHAHAPCRQGLGRRTGRRSAGFPWRSGWPAASAPAWPASASPKRWMNTPRCATSESAKTDRYFWHRRWNCNEYESKYSRRGAEESGYDRLPAPSAPERSTANWWI